MKHQSSIPALLLTLLLALSPALAAKAVDETREARANAQIEFSAVSGEYRIVGSDEAVLAITGTLGDDTEALLIDGDPDNWTIEVKPKRNYRGTGRSTASDLTITVPAGARLDMNVVSARAELRNLSGRSVHAQSVSGKLELIDVRPGRLSVESVSGTLELNAGSDSDTRLKTVSGNITAGNLSGRVRVGTVSGNVDIAASAVDSAEMETVSGRILARLQPADNADIQLSSHSGRLQLQLPADTPVDFRASSFSGTISNEFGGETEDIRGRGPGRAMEVRSGRGSVQVQARSFSGGIYLETL